MPRKVVKPKKKPGDRRKEDRRKEFTVPFGSSTIMRNGVKVYKANFWRSKEIVEKEGQMPKALTDSKGNAVEYRGKFLIPDERVEQRRHRIRRTGPKERRKRQLKPVRVDKGTLIYRRKKERQIFESPNTRRSLIYTPEESRNLPKGTNKKSGRKGRHTDK